MNLRQVFLAHLVSQKTAQNAKKSSNGGFMDVCAASLDVGIH